MLHVILSNGNIGILSANVRQRHLLQLANVERRLAKRELGGNFARARVFYRAATEELRGYSAEVSTPAEQQANNQVDSKSDQQQQQQDSNCQPAAQQESRSGPEVGGTEALQHWLDGPAESLPASSASSDEGTSLQKDLVRGLQSWARMEGFLG